MNIQPISQRDERWKNKKLGFSNLTIGNYGCTLTCLTMLINYVEGASYTPDQVNDRLKEVKGFIGALVLWSRVPSAFPSLNWIKRGYNYNNYEVGWYVYARRTPVMVEVNGAKIGAPRHWVLFTGNRKQIDPWFGNTSPTWTYPLTGYSLFQKTKQP